MRFSLSLSALFLVFACFACGENKDEDTSEAESNLSPIGDCVSKKEYKSDLFADCIESFAPTDDTTLGQDKIPSIVLGAPKGGGEYQGSVDVLSLGCDGEIILYFSDPIIGNGEGMDFVVFENPFMSKGSSEIFVEPGEVSVSNDLKEWYTFPCKLSGENALSGCAGVHPVYAGSGEETSGSDISALGGDQFDLAEVGVSKARYVRIVDKTAEYYGNEVWCAPPGGGFDLDAIGIINSVKTDN